MNKEENKQRMIEQIKMMKKKEKMIDSILAEEIKAYDEAEKIIGTLKKKTEINQFASEIKSFMKKDMNSNNSIIAEYIQDAIIRYIDEQVLHNIIIKNPQDKEKVKHYEKYLQMLKKEPFIVSKDIKTMSVTQHSVDSMTMFLINQRENAIRHNATHKTMKKYFEKRQDEKKQEQEQVAKFMDEVIPKR